MALFTINIDKTQQEAVEYIATYIDDHLDLPAVVDAIDYGIYCKIADIVIEALENLVENLGIINIKFADEDK